METPAYIPFRRHLMGPALLAGSDHFLVVRGLVVQRFHRIYFHELQAVEVRPTHRRMHQVFFSLVTVMLMVGVAWDYPVEEARIPLLICAAAALGALGLALWSGPTVEMMLHTRTTSVPVRVVARLKSARAAMDWIEQRVAPVQGEGWYAAPDDPGVPPRIAPAPDDRLPALPAALVAVTCLVAAGAYSWVSTHTSFSTWMGAILVSLLVFGSALAVLIRHRRVRPEDPVRGWLGLVLAVALMLMYSGMTIWSMLFGVITALRDSDVLAEPELMMFFRIGRPLLHGVAQSLALVFLALAVFGLVRLARNPTQPSTPDGPA